MRNAILQNRKNISTGLFVVWVILACDWAHSIFGKRLPVYEGSSTPIDYWALLDRHSYAFSPWVAGGILLIGIVLLANSRNLWIVLLIIPFGMCAAVMIVFARIANTRTTLTHLDTIRFDERIYHLTYGVTIDSGPIDLLFLHQCDETGDLCTGRRLAPWGSEDAELRVDEASNQLNVISEGRVIYTVDAPDAAVDIPLQRERINLATVDAIQEVARLQYDDIQDLAWSSDGNMLAAAGFNAIWLLRFQTGTVDTDMVSTFAYASGIAISPDGRLLAATDYLNGPLTVWHVDDLTERISRQLYYTGDVAFSPDSALLATGANREVWLLDTENFYESSSFAFKERTWLHTLSFSPFGIFLAATGRTSDGTTERSFVRVWNVRTENEVFNYRSSYSSRYSNAQTKAAFSPDGLLLAIAITEELNPNDFDFSDFVLRIRIWDFRNNEEVLVTEVPYSAYRFGEIVWTREGDVLITSDDTGHILFWDASSGELLRSIEVQPRPVEALALSPDGTILASGARDGTIRLWAVPSAADS